MFLFSRYFIVPFMRRKVIAKCLITANFAKEGKNKRYHGNKNLILSEHNHEFDTKQVFCTLIM